MIVVRILMVEISVANGIAIMIIPTTLNSFSFYI